MSEQIVNPDASGKNPEEQPTPQFTKADVDSAAAAARREATAKLQEAQERLTALEAEKKEREEAELTELEKLKKQIGEYDEKFKAVANERDTFKTKIEAINEQTATKAEKESEGLTDEQKAIIEALPLEKKLDAITQFKKVTAPAGEWGKGAPAGSPDFKEKLKKATTFQEREQILKEQLAAGR